jgi:predicted O-linked N-acetylglucosamine transferase (SPINDLY family)
MLNPATLNLLPLWQQQAYKQLLNEDYALAAFLYEQAISDAPEVRSYYWHLGLIQFLQQHQADAETTWFLPMLEQDETEIEHMRVELAEVLLIEVARQVELENLNTALSLSRYVQELAPNHVNNLLQIIQLKINLQIFEQQDFTLLELIELLHLKYPLDFDVNLMQAVIQSLLNNDVLSYTTYKLSKACLPYINKLPSLTNLLCEATIKILLLGNSSLAIAYGELCLGFQNPTLTSLEFLARVYIIANTELLLAIDLSALAFDLSKKIDTSGSQQLLTKIATHKTLLSALLHTGCQWQKIQKGFEEQKKLLIELASQPNLSLKHSEILNLFTLSFLTPHIEDQPRLNRPILNQISAICQTSIEKHCKEQVDRCRKLRANIPPVVNSKRNLKIGYLSANLKRHPIGLLARWLFQYHDRNQFQIYTYLVNCPAYITDPLQNWYASQVSCARKVGLNGAEIAEIIRKDNIDILIDLESNTLDINCEVLAIKPAPVQATWLGFDSTGLPAVDYFIADPYVVPESAQDYYNEKICRLPHTYLAVDGFEVGVPTLRREHLGIPSDAIVFFSAQRANKRHPRTVRLQMQIIKSVAGSYFLIKSKNNQESLQKFFYEIACEEGVSSDRLKFLPMDPSEEAHRANLSIADVVLDTYPYNGATTTLEALWMGIPMVTRVGEQFSARNSYTFMVNANTTEGIAWTDEEYVEWGIRLGKDEALRKEVHWKLLNSRQTAPLWNAKQFARDMETAYQQMWDSHING